LSEAGLLSVYFRETLEAADAGVVKLGIEVADAIGRVTYCDEFVRVVDIFIEFLISRVAELGDELIQVLSCLNSFPEYMGPMKQEGLQEDYERLLEYEQYAEFAQFFLANAARM
jgi:NTP pyrophosphatase (non-canonical NTP hydrolase)